MITRTNLFYLGLIAIPLFLLLFIGFFVIPVQGDYLREACNFIITTAFFYSIAFLFPSERLQRYISFFNGIVLSILVFFKLSFYYTYQTKLSASAFFVIFETNSQEATEFLEVYFNKVCIGMALLVIGYLILLWKMLFKQHYHFDFSALKKTALLVRLCFFINIFLCAYLIQWKFSDYNILYKTKTSYKDYKATKELLRQALSKPESDFLKNVCRSENAPKTAVVIVGESTSREHMGIYGYYRNTTPLLSAMRKELLVANNVITPHVHTVTALEKIFTLSSVEIPDKKNNASIIQLANQAGYDTYWISNQRPVGINETIPTLLGYGAKHKIFLNTNDYNRQSHDEVLLPELENALANDAEYKLIFLHLSGTHVGYAERYPDSFEFYTDTPKTSYKHTKAFERINEYDNAIRYNDFIVSEIIARVKNLKTASYVLYFSDHGDDVFDFQNGVGHNEYNPTKPMYEIPFMFWFSEKYKQDFLPGSSFSDFENRAYMLDDFIHTFSDVTRINFDAYQNEKSFFADDFQPKKRIIKKKGDYDRW